MDLTGHKFRINKTFQTEKELNISILNRKVKERDAFIALLYDIDRVDWMGQERKKVQAQLLFVLMR